MKDKIKNLKQKRLLSNVIEGMKDIPRMIKINNYNDGYNLSLNITLNDKYGYYGSYDTLDIVFDIDNYMYLIEGLINNLKTGIETNTNEQVNETTKECINLIKEIDYRKDIKELVKLNKSVNIKLNNEIHVDDMIDMIVPMLSDIIILDWVMGNENYRFEWIKR